VQNLPKFRCHGNKGQPHNILYGSNESAIPEYPLVGPNISGLSAIQADSGDFVPKNLGSKFWQLGGLNQQESPADARVTRDGAVIPRWPSAAILDTIELEIAPFDPPTPKTLA